MQEEPNRIFNNPDWAYSWPQEEVLETLALAQHHGIPTRAFSFSCLVGKAHHVESFAEMGIVAA